MCCFSEVMMVDFLPLRRNYTTEIPEIWYQDFILNRLYNTTQSETTIKIVKYKNVGLDSKHVEK